jgi:hypothetical protein
VSTQPPAAPGDPQLPPPGTLRCPRCSSPVGPEQDWCLECGAPARTRLAQTPNWQLPTVAIGAIVLIAGAMLAFAFVKLTSDDGGTPAATTATTPAVVAPPPVLPPASTTPAPVTTTPAPGTTTPGTTTPGTTTPGTTTPGTTTPGTTTPKTTTQTPPPPPPPGAPLAPRTTSTTP